MARREERLSTVEHWMLSPVVYGHEHRVFIPTFGSEKKICDGGMADGSNGLSPRGYSKANQMDPNGRIGMIHCWLQWQG